MSAPDWKDISIALAASNARLCAIALKADDLAAAVAALEHAHTFANLDKLQAALDDYKITWNGE